MRRRPGLLILCALAAGALNSVAFGQCPNGSPPPCGSSKVVTLARRADAPLDARTWIVVPFENVTKASDIEWLSRASVNLLYLSLSTWSDIRVVDDARVGEILLEVAGPQQGPVTLSSALKMAKRVGAAHLVMGDFLKAGSTTAVTAKVFDVATGARIRSVQENAPAADSIMPAYRRLAPRILDVSESVAASAGQTGTRSLSAYQEYLRGLQALKRFDFSASQSQFRRALELDSSFALAHYRLAQSIAYASNTTDTLVATHASAAARLGTALPVRERSLIRALSQMAARNPPGYSEGCDTYRELLRTDSLDVEALFGLGYCSVRDPTLDATDGDTTRLRFRSSLNVALQSFRRVLELEPSNHLAFDQILSVLVSQARVGCLERRANGVCASTRLGILRNQDDTLVTTPVNVGDSLVALHLAEAARTRTRALNLEKARRLAVSWIDIAPDEPRAHLALGGVLLQIGRLEEAQRELSRRDVTGLKESATQRSLLAWRVELAVKQWRGVEAARLVDSVLVSSADTTFRASWARFYGPPFGHLRELDSMAAKVDQTLPANLRGARAIALRAMLGFTADSIAAAHVRLIPSATMASFRARTQLSEYEGFAFGLRLPMKDWPALEPGRPDAFRANLVTALSRNDTATMRINAAALDSMTRAGIRAQVPDTGSSIIAADAYLILGDSAAALRSLRRMLDSTVAQTPYGTPLTAGSRVYVLDALPSVGWMWSRGALLRAELADALGYKDEARLWYGRFLDLWSKADAEYAPLLARVRSAQAALPKQ